MLRSSRATISVVSVLILVTSCGGPADPPPPSSNYDSHVFAGGKTPPAGALVNPFQGDREAAADGGRLFTTMNCAECHGGGAVGFMGPSLIDGRWRYGGTDGAIFQSIHYGRPRGMPAYGGMLPPAAVWKIVTYLRAQPVPTNVPTQTWE